MSSFESISPLLSASIWSKIAFARSMAELVPGLLATYGCNSRSQHCALSTAEGVRLRGTDHPNFGVTQSEQTGRSSPAHLETESLFSLYIPENTRGVTLLSYCL